MARNS
jgi:hypothetical protein